MFRAGAMTVDTSNWERAREWIRSAIASNELAEGDQLPPESDMQREIGVGRHSLRRAVAALAAEGVLSVEQGRGTFVREPARITYRIGSRTRFRENLLRQGVEPGGDTISAEVVPADCEIAGVLGLAEGADVTRVITRGRADGRPILLTCSFHPYDRFPDLARRRLSRESVTDIYAAHGVTDYARKETALHSRLPQKWEARMLEQPADQPVVVISKIDADPEGFPIGHAESIWSAGRVRFSLDHAEPTGRTRHV
ncbi:phosphonate metabolism transcriptional regulator PhnF [Psychromarinibacter sp. S121]|uniref:phosphonate metabolism transcriptional regulator PhnF n=1 Tax=Psychromarinibacter sp. S121 TaxID=3415127 RepID=UPI003C7C0C85